MALLLAGHQADERLCLHHPRLRDAVGIDAEEAHAALGPEVAGDGGLDCLLWWQEQADKFPNVAVMARQYLGCPASSATVERLFSQVGIAFSAKRKSAEAETVADIMFSRANLP